MASVKHLSHRRFVVSFQIDSIQRSDQGLYRCVTQSPRGSGVSNFAELVVKGKHSLFCASCCFLLILSSQLWVILLFFWWCMIFSDTVDYRVIQKRMKKEIGHCLCMIAKILFHPFLIYCSKIPLITNCMLPDTLNGSLDAVTLAKLRVSNRLPSWALQLSVRKLLTWLRLLQLLSYHVPQMVTSVPLLTPTSQPDTTLTAW